MKNKIQSKLELIKEAFKDDEMLIQRKFNNQYNQNIKFVIFFINGMVDNNIINNDIIKPLVDNKELSTGKGFVHRLNNQIIHSNNIKETNENDELIKAIISGDTVLLVEDYQESLIIATRKVESRQIQEPLSERVLRGPREGFTESITTNLTLIRKRLQIDNLKFKYRTFGKNTQTKVCICYIDGIASEKILKELDKRLGSVKDINGIIDSHYIQEYIVDSPYSPLETVGSTERPDIVAAKLLEGRVAIVVNGTPVALTLPYLFIEYLQSNDDYYINYYFSSLGRMLRIIGFFLTISIPAIYISLISFHKEIIPTELLLSIYAARQSIPFPTVIELLALLLVFEVLREAGTRMPSNFGQALSIVGALVLGQAAVNAKFVSAPIVIVVGFSGITSLMVPRLTGAIIIIRLFFIFIASFIGLYGYIYGVAALLIHLFSLRSFGVPYMSKTNSYKLSDIKDTAIRAPWWYMKKKHENYIKNHK